MHQQDILKYYSRSDVQKSIAAAARDREVAGTVRDGGYQKRPDIVQYPGDILEKAKRGAVAFHLSVERWSNPLAVSQANMGELRRGWDMIVDIDSKGKLEHARATAVSVVDLLRDYGITPTVKFSGRRGFHIGVAWEAFPEKSDFQQTAQRYPEALRALTSFAKEKLRETVMEKLVEEEGGVSALMGTVKDAKDLSPWNFVEIETNWGARHLFRAPYSLHNGTWLVSVPIKLFKLKTFSPEAAKPETVKADQEFLVNKVGEATSFFVDAMDWWAKMRAEEAEPAVRRAPSGRKARIPEEHFPPCVKIVMAGLQDGRKRSLFTLVNFLRAVGWGDEEIKKKIEEVNLKHAQPLPSRLVSGHIKYHLGKRDSVPPPNCTNADYYDSIGICKPDGLCANKAIKNPVNYAVRSYIRAKGQEKRAKQNDKSVKRKTVRRK